jgi:hypothetical protein
MTHPCRLPTRQTVRVTNCTNVLNSGTPRSSTRWWQRVDTPSQPPSVAARPTRKKNTPSAPFVCLFVCLGVSKASQEGALQRHPGIELSFHIPMYGGYDLGCHRRFPFYLRRDFHPFSRARITEGCVAYVLNSLSSWRRAGRRVFRFGKIV